MLHRRVRGVVLAGIAGLLLAAGTVRAQGGGGPGGGPGGFRMFGQGGSSPMPQDTVDRYQRMLNVTSEQRAKIKEAYNAYKAQYDTEEAAMQEKMSDARLEARDSGDPGAAMRAMQAPMTEFRDATKKMESEFLAHFKAALTSEQASNWTRVERAVRREKASAGMLVAGGERPDLTAIVDKMDLPEAAKAPVNPILEQYEQDMDKELAVRGKVNDEVMAKMQELRPQGGNGGNQGNGGRGNRNGNNANGGDPRAMFEEALKKMQPVIDKAKESSSAVQEINRRYAAKVQSALPEDRRGQFARLVKEAKFPNVYTPSLISRQLSAALELPDLDEKQKASVKALQATYTKEVTAVNEKLAAATEKDEADRLSQPGLGFGPGGRGRGGQGSEMGDLRQEKRDLDADTRDDLGKILSQAQMEKLPKQAPRAQGQFQFGGPGGGQGGGGGMRGGDQGGGRRGRGGGGG